MNFQQILTKQCKEYTEKCRWYMKRFSGSIRKKVSKVWQRHSQGNHYRETIDKLTKKSKGFPGRKFSGRTLPAEGKVLIAAPLRIILVWKHWDERCEIGESRSWGWEWGGRGGGGRARARFRRNSMSCQGRVSFDALGCWSKVIEYLQIGYWHLQIYNLE